jgi:hypothetical protein
MMDVSMKEHDTLSEWMETSHRDSWVRCVKFLHAVVQLRMLGGALGLALVTAITNSTLNSTWTDMLPIFRSTRAIQNLPEPFRRAVREAFLDGYNTQLHILAGFAEYRWFRGVDIARSDLRVSSLGRS